MPHPKEVLGPGPTDNLLEQRELKQAMSMKYAIAIEPGTIARLALQARQRSLPCLASSHRAAPRRGEL